MPVARRVVLVATGGTVGSAVAEGVAVVDGAALDAVCRFASECVADEGVELVVRAPFLLHSEQLGPGHWLRVAEAIRSTAGEVDGALVLHGTDTAAYTAAALSYLLADLDLPVVVTGSSLPSSSPGSDAATNVRGGACAAGALPGGSYLAFASDDGEVVVHLGTRVRKRRSGPVAFEGVARQPVARVVDGRLVLVDPPPSGPALSWARPGLDDRVHVIGCHPGQRLVGLVDWAVANGMRAVLLRLYAGLTAPTGSGERSAEAAVARATAAGLVAAATNGSGDAAGRGPVRYPSTRALEEAGVVLLDSLPIEAALPKLMWALAQSEDPGEVGALLRTSIRGDLVNAAAEPSADAAP